MSEESKIIHRRIGERLAELKISAAAASKLATGKPDLVRDIKRGMDPSAIKLGKLAGVLETSVDYLLGRTRNRLDPAWWEASTERPVDGAMLRAAVRLASKVAKKHGVSGEPLGDGDLADLIAFLYGEGDLLNPDTTAEDKAAVAVRFLRFRRSGSFAEPPSLREPGSPTLHDPDGEPEFAAAKPSAAKD